MILILDSGDAKHCLALQDALQRRGVETAYWDVSRFPLYDTMTFYPTQPKASQLRLEAGTITASDIRAVYCLYTPFWRRPMDIQVDIQEAGSQAGWGLSPQIQQTLSQEIESALGNLFLSLTCPWVDSPQSFSGHFYKGKQLLQLAQAGLRVPDTVFTNDPEQVKQFYEKHLGRIVCKPCWFGAYAEAVQAEDLLPERLTGLTQAPVQFQNYIPGTDILVYGLDGEFFAVACHVTNAAQYEGLVDFRQVGVSQIRFEPLVLPELVQADCLKAMQVLNQRFSALDLRQTPEGEYVFIEANPSPTYLHVTAQTGFPILEQLSAYLERLMYC